MSTRVAFEVLRFAGGPVSSEVALLELEGRFDPKVARGRERAHLVLDTADGSLELPPAAVAALPGGVWRGTYAVPLAVLGGAVYSLALSRDLLLDLPAPDVTATAGGPATHHVRLARETNELRRHLDEAEEVRAAALAEAEEVRAAALAEAQEATGALDAERRAREQADAEHETKAAALAEATGALERAEAALREAETKAEERIAAAREEVESSLAEARAAHDRALETAHTETERRLEETVAAERARASKTSHELRSARAEIESLKRELAMRRREKPGANGSGDEAATRRTEPVRVGAEAPTQVVEGDTVREPASRPPRPRHRADDQPQPSALPPGAAATGARSLEPAVGPASSSSRLLAVVALGVAVLAAVLVVFLRVGIV